MVGDRTEASHHPGGFRRPRDLAGRRGAWARRGMGVWHGSLAASVALAVTLIAVQVLVAAEAVIATVPLGTFSPWDIAFHPGLNRVYISDSYFTQSVAVVDAATNSLL